MKAEKPIIAIFVLSALMIVATVYGAIVAEKNWQEYKKEHNCVLISEVIGHTTATPIIGSDGSIHTAITTTPSTKTYKCDNKIITR